jgi:hypothetical protein
MKPLLIILLLFSQFALSYDTSLRIEGRPTIRDIGQTSDVFGPPVSRRIITKKDIPVVQITVEPILFSPEIPKGITADEKLLELVWEDGDWSLTAWFRRVDGKWVSFGENQKGGVRF